MMATRPLPRPLLAVLLGLAVAWAALAGELEALAAVAVLPPFALGLAAATTGTVYSSSRSDWGGPRSIGSPIGRVSTIFVHTEAGSVMPAGTSLAQERARMLAIHRFHLSLGWAGFGYSAGVQPTSTAGRVHEGRGYRRAGAHTSGYNTSSLAVVCLGHGDRAGITDEALQAIRAWVGAGVEAGAIAPDPRIRGHRDVSPKSCPGNLVYPKLSRLAGVTGPEPLPSAGGTRPPAPSDPAPTKDWFTMATRQDLEEVVRAVVKDELRSSLTHQRVNEAVRLAQAAAFDAVGRARADFGLEPEPESDAIQVARLREGKHRNIEPYRMEDVRAALEERARREGRL